MRKVSFTLNVSIDGCFEHTFIAPDNELMEYFTDIMRNTGLLIYGRKTYELMVPYWPEIAAGKAAPPADRAFANAMVPIKKIVVSRTLKNAEENTTIINGDLERVIIDQKGLPGKMIAISGTTLLPHLLEQGLIDELNLIVHPILVGDRKRLFNDLLLTDKIDFRLESTQKFSSGAIALQYSKK